MPVLDTTFAIDLLRGDDDATKILALLQKGTAPIGVTPHTHFELYAGVGRSRRADLEAAAVDDLLSDLSLFEFTPEAAKLAGILDAELGRTGRRIGLVDLLIGATALHHGETIVTRNKKDFSAIPGLELLTY